MTNKVKPTVEKWRAKIHDIFISATLGAEATYEERKRYEKRIFDVVAHSVQEAKDVASKEKFEMLQASLKVKNEAFQEAKAERDREWVKAMGEMEDVGMGNEYNPSAGMKCRNCFRADILRRLGCEFEWQQVLGKTTNEKHGRKMIPISDLLVSLKQEDEK